MLSNSLRAISRPSVFRTAQRFYATGGYKDFVLHISGTDRIGLINHVAKTCITPVGGNIGTTRMTQLGSEMSMLFEVTVSAQKEKEFHDLLNKNVSSPDIKFFAKEIDERALEPTGDVLKSWRIFGPDSQQLTEKLTAWCAERQISVVDYSSHIFPGGHIGYDIFEVSIRLSIPKSLDVVQISKEFEAFSATLGMESEEAKSVDLGLGFGEQ
uniref:ACT domain-containing protein n=1 Tax=Chromera velia CCMP2878 TaxID=1169474 RepID=A0A0K6S7B2_9ALVE|mmetsp:Transcript_20964/g.41858  ORF Transcript_20964/g.41858 Transcript_20964/m.41858 type:complete len:212 (+) Transcript_20964:154-789(+)|eukprot:Cvel_19906.t1-p1 / transcript=Cvel_19906.t1 / gene=Cvel_19906 / organism=Chromera_velia_CCMP2878 / gene_product=hypothetical protein / transcript_product=hypothetical protein / location=Cvel_scaffold1750:3724-6263(-) / protein_length=211 / sequence_SO=supercontig / SO=protein_coding / is_pseudo=false